ncbi:MAG: hypothetical protein KatS3mg102_1551 [Planctomycetota bacterium]|nr:MAG: hypothetical protein KatS3mg102_1551 [Planctomycetota bacterium]
MGSELAASLARLGVRVLAVSNRLGCLRARSGSQGLELGAVLRARAERGERWLLEPAAAGPGAERCEREALFEVECELLFACADAGSLDCAAAERLAARAVVPAANEPLGPGAERCLEQRGVLVLPDCAVNSGGILGSFLAGFGIAPGRLERLEHALYRAALGRLLARAEAAHTSPYALGRALADRLAARRARASWPVRRAHGVLGRLRRAPPPWRQLAGELALGWARRWFARLFAEEG